MMMSLGCLVSSAGRITSGIETNMEMEYVGQRGTVGKKALRRGIGRSSAEKRCLRVGQDSPAAEHVSGVVGEVCPAVGHDTPTVERGTFVMGQEFPVVGLDSSTAGHGTVVLEENVSAVRRDSPFIGLVVGQQFPVVRHQSPVTDQGSTVLEQEFPAVRPDSSCFSQSSPLIKRRYMSRLYVFGQDLVSEMVAIAGYSSSQSSRLNHTSKVVRGSACSYRSVWSLPLCLLFLLAELHISSTGQCPPTSEEDLISKTILAKVVLVGQSFGQSSRQEPAVEGLWTAEFNVEELLKGTDLLFENRVHVSGELLMGEGERGCNLSTVKGSKYFVFLNGSDEVHSDGRRIHWTSGLPVQFSKAAKKTVKRFSCATCAKAPRVKLTPRSLPPIARFAPLSLRCNVSGRPTPTITWYKGPEVLSVEGQRIKTSRNGAQLTIRRFQSSDAGHYKCEASNVLGSVNSSSVTVKVSSPQDNASTPAARDHAVICEKQGHCVNGGTCFTYPSIGKFCGCRQGFDGVRCQDRTVATGEKKARPEESMDGNLRTLLIVGLILFGFILFVLTVIAYCLAMTRYDNLRRMNHSTAEDTAEPDVRANGGALLRSLNGLQAEKKMQKFTSANGAGGDSSVDDNKRVGLPQVLVTLIEDEDRTRTTITSGGNGELPAENAKRPAVRVYCPPDQCSTCPNLSRPRLAAVSTTPSSAASSINLHMEHPEGQTAVDEHMGSSC